MTSIPNDATALCFHGNKESEAPEVSAVQIGQIASSLENFLATTSEVLGNKCDFQINIVAPPTRGSLVIWIRYAVKNIINSSIDDPISQSRAQTVANYAAFGLVIWTLCFGDKGLYDLIVSRSPAETVVNTKDEDIKPRKLEEFTNSRLLENAFEIYRACKSTDSQRVEIHLPDSSPTCIFDRKWVRDFHLIGAFANPAPLRDGYYMPDATGENIPFKLEKTHGNAIASQLRNDSTDHVTDSAVYLTLWFGNTSIPMHHNPERFRPLATKDFDRIEFSSDIPDEYTRVRGVMAVGIGDHSYGAAEDI